MKRRSFSLLELLLALALITLCASMAAFKFYKGYKSRQEENSIDLVKNKLTFANQLAKITHGTVRVVIDESTPEKYIYIAPELGVHESTNRLIANPEKLDLVTDIRLEGQSPWLRDTSIAYTPWGIEDEESTLSLTFTSGMHATVEPKKFASIDTTSWQNEYSDLYPQEVLQDENEKKLIHTD